MFPSASVPRPRVGLGFMVAGLVLGLALLGAGPARAGGVAPYNGCQPNDAGQFVCNWSPNPVFAESGAIVGVLYAEPYHGLLTGANTIECQQPGGIALVPADPDGETSTEWAWAEATNGNWGWTSEAGADWGLGAPGYNFTGFANVPDCSDHGPAPGTGGFGQAMLLAPGPAPAAAVPVPHPNARLITAGAAAPTRAGCTRRQWVTVAFRLHASRIELAHGRSIEPRGRDARLARLQIGDSTCFSTGAPSYWLEGDSVALRIRHSGLRQTRSGPVIAGRGVTRGWGIAVTRATRRGVIHVHELACARGGLGRLPKTLRAHRWAPPTRHVRFSAGWAPRARHASLRGCADLADAVVSVAASAHGRLTAVVSRAAAGGLTTERRHPKGHRVLLTRTLVAPDVLAGRR